MRPGRSRSRSRVAWNKGKRMSELTKRKISLAQKRRHADAPALRAGVRAKLQVRAVFLSLRKGCNTRHRKNSWEHSLGTPLRVG